MYKQVPEGVTGPAAFGYSAPTDERVTRGIDDRIRTTLGASWRAR